MSAFSATPFGPTVRPPGAAATYALAWRLKVPAAGIELLLRAVARHQFVTMQILLGLWEAAAAVHGPRGVCTVENSRGALRLTARRRIGGAWTAEPGHGGSAC